MAKNHVGDPDRFSRLVARAEFLARADDWGDEAGKLNAAIVKLDPVNLSAHTRLAKWCLKRGRSGEAEQLYRRVLQLDRTNRIARNHLDEIVRNRRYQMTANNLTTYSEAFRRGVEERRRGNSELAAVILRRAESLASHDACRVALGAAYRDLQMLERAEAVYRDVLSRDPSKAAQVGLAAVLRDQGRRSEAAVLCRAVLARYPGDQYAQATLAAIQADARRN